MKPTWLIEDFDPDDSRLPLLEEVKSQGFPYQLLTFESGNYDSIPNSSKECVIFQGTLNLGRQLRREKQWIPGVWCDLEAFKCTSYYPYFGKYLLNADYIFVPVYELKRKKQELYDIFGTDDSIFIRPNSAFKTFTGKAVEKKHFESELEWMTEYSDKNSLAVVASPKPIDVEYRLITCEQKVITGSTIRVHGELKKETINLNDTKLIEYAEKICREVDFQADPIYVMDVCRMYGELYVVELNSFSCSGLYACDLKIIVEKASELAEKEWREYNV